MRSLVYTGTRRDADLRGTITVHGVPEQAQEIQAWLERLGLQEDLPYRGEGLPAMSHKVRLHLLRLEGLALLELEPAKTYTLNSLASAQQRQQQVLVRQLTEVRELLAGAPGTPGARAPLSTRRP